MSTDSITLTGLRVNAHHGVYDFEKRERPGLRHRRHRLARPGSRRSERRRQPDDPLRRAGRRGHRGGQAQPGRPDRDGRRAHRRGGARPCGGRAGAGDGAQARRADLGAVHGCRGADRADARMSPAPGAPRGASVVLALGSNLGDRAATLARATRAIADLDGLDLRRRLARLRDAAVKPGGVDLDAPAVPQRRRHRPLRRRPVHAARRRQRD